ncbi:MAG: hypothetical protein IJ629_00210 [Clostridia bacterium]|nr:hypothetical protein [Clostridia bacterium]
MKKIRNIVAICFLMITYCYFINIYNFPNKILLYSDSSLNYRICPFLTLKGEVLTSSSGKSKGYHVSLCLGDIHVKEIEVKRTEKIEVVPIGNLVGLKVYAKGIIIVGFSPIKKIDGETVSLEETTSLKKGEKIVEVNGMKINTIEELKKVIVLSKEAELSLKVEDTSGNQRTEVITPIQDASNSYKLGLWVKDAATGVGTLSFYLPETGEFACLGHGIIDADTQSLIEIEDGNLTSTKVLEIKKGSSRKSGRNKRNC